MSSKRRMMTPHPFHIVGECQECCDESEAMWLGCPEMPRPGDCETPGCVNGPAGSGVSPNPKGADE